VLGIYLQKFVFYCGPNLTMNAPEQFALLQ